MLPGVRSKRSNLRQGPEVTYCWPEGESVHRDTAEEGPLPSGWFSAGLPKVFWKDVKTGDIDSALGSGCILLCFFCLFDFEARFCYVVQSGLEFTVILLP